MLPGTGLSLYLKTGQQGYFEGYYSPLHDEAGEVIGGLAVIRDITERHRVEQDLRESESKYRMLVEQASDGTSPFTTSVVRLSKRTAALVRS